MIGVSFTLILLLVEILIMEYEEYMHAVLVREIRDRTNQEAISYMTISDVDEIIGDIEKLIAEYRERSKKRDTRNLPYLLSK